MKYRFRITDFSISAAGELPACTNRGTHTNRTDSTAQPGILACRFWRTELVRLITITRQVLRQAERQKISTPYDAVKALNHNDYAHDLHLQTIVLASTNSTFLQGTLRFLRCVGERNRRTLAGMPCFRSATVMLAFGVLFASGMFRPALAQTPANVMVVINDASPESVRIGEYYVAKRRIPPENVVRLKMAVADEMDRAAYEVLHRAADFGKPDAACDPGPHSLHRRHERHSAASTWNVRARGQRRQRRFRVDAAVSQAARNADSACRKNSESVLPGRSRAFWRATLCASDARHFPGDAPRWFQRR